MREITIETAGERKACRRGSEEKGENKKLTRQKRKKISI